MGYCESNEQVVGASSCWVPLGEAAAAHWELCPSRRKEAEAFIHQLCISAEAEGCSRRVNSFLYPACPSQGQVHQDQGKPFMDAPGLHSGEKE